MPNSPSRLSRRNLFAAGAGAAGALAATVGVMQATQTASKAPEPDLPKPERGGGYVLSERVKQYYQSARV